MTALWDQSVWGVPWGVAVLASLCAAWCDLRHWRIPNLLTIPLMLAGVAWSVWAAGFPGLGESLAGVGLMGLPFIVLYAFAGGGAGDAKMMMGIGAWLGPVGALVALLCVTVTGALVAVAYALRKRHGKRMARNLGSAALGAMGVVKRQMSVEDASVLMPTPDQMLAMPYGAAIGLGMMIAGGGVWLWKM